MAKPTPHTALEGMGFKLVGRDSSGSSNRVGTATRHHYTMTSNTVGGKPSVDSIVRPITHHVVVDEFSKAPGKYNTSYHVTQDGEPYSEGDYDTYRRHKDNDNSRGVADPIRDIMDHHQGVMGAFRREKAPTAVDVNQNNIHMLIPAQQHLVERPMVHLNSAQDQPLDPYVHNTLTKSFNYMGRISPDDPHTDVYHVSYEDPQDPHMRYGFTVRHMPEATSSPVTDYRRGNKGRKDPLLPKPLVFSYDATHYPTNMTEDDGSYPTGDFLPVTGEGSPVAGFTRLGPLVERHHNILRSVGLMKLPPKRRRPDWHFTAAADEFDNIISGNGAAGPCWSCGKATYNYPEGKSLQSDSSVPINAREETGGDMHGPDINLCGNCATDDMNYHMAVTHGSRGPGRIWHYNDQSVPGCPGCEANLMDQADEDLRP